MPLSAAEQYFLELQNRARLDPLAEAAREGIDLNDGLAAGTLHSGSRDVLAPNEFLNEAAANHSLWMLEADVFSHTGSGGSSPGDRIEAEGYVFTGSSSWGENIAWSGTTGTVNLNTAIAGHHSLLFKSASHRMNTLNDGFVEIGIGQVSGQFFTSGRNWNASMLSVDFARSGTSVFVTGVAYNDTNLDRFYSIGEGRAGVTFQILGGTTTANGDAGGYALATNAAAATTVQITHGSFTSQVVVDTTGGNVKLDLVGDQVAFSSGSITLVSGQVTEVMLLGRNGLSATGNGADNKLVGNLGANLLRGGLGNDTLEGGAGNDTLLGGAGADQMLGGEGIRDLADYSDATAGLRADLQVPLYNTGFATGDNLFEVEDLNGSAHGDTLLGDATANMIWGGGGNDAWLDGRLGNDTLSGGDGNDVLIGGQGADALSGGTGTRDRAQYTDSAGVRADLLSAQFNTGFAAGDTYDQVEDLHGSFQTDTLFGDAGGNVIWGAHGNDLIDGRSGNDTLLGGAGNDTISGGTGADVFIFDSALGASNVDQINGYAAFDDVIHLENAIFSALTPPGTLANSAFTIGESATTASHRIIYNSATGQLLYDADGSGEGAATQFATLSAGLAMTAAEFFVI